MKIAEAARTAVMTADAKVADSWTAEGMGRARRAYRGCGHGGGGVNKG